MYRLNEEEAIEVLSGVNNMDVVYATHDIIAACQTAIKALKYRLPEKITHEATLAVCPTCPRCKNVVGEKVKLFGKITIAIPNYCHFCGQRIKW